MDGMDESEMFLSFSLYLTVWNRRVRDFFILLVVISTLLNCMDGMGESEIQGYNMC